MDLPTLKPGKLVKRYNRFLADVVFDDGHAETVHCPNPGSMMGLKEPGLKVWCSTSDNPKRKLKSTLELIDADGGLVGINTNNPNKLAAEAIRNDTIAELTGYAALRPEVKYGENSRIDLLLSDDNRPDCYVEVKNVHLMRTRGLAEFPDSVTSRGAKHLVELSNMVAAGHRAVMLYVVQRSDCESFQTVEEIDPVYHEGLKTAADAGVEVICYDCDVTVESIRVRRALPWRRF